jgi:hypothetical protein
MLTKQLEKSGAGWANTSFFLDPESGIAVVLGTQIHGPPPNDAEYERVYSEVEHALYEGLSAVASS